MFIIIIIFFITATFFGISPQAGYSRDWFVAPNGKPMNEGTETAPFDLMTAFVSNGIKPGDTVWIDGGTYKGLFTSTLKGAKEKPIIVRVIKGSKATVDGGLNIQGSHTWVWGLEVTNSEPDRFIRRPTGVNCFGVGTRLINLIVHDCGLGIGFWRPVQEGEVYGCIIYKNGWQEDARDRRHGHGIYTQNEVGTKRLLDNIIFDQLGWGIHAYTEKGSINGFHIEGNIIFNNGSMTRQNARYENILVGGHTPAERITIISNCTYHTPELSGRNVRLHYTARNNKNLVCQDNYFSGGSDVLSVKEWEWIFMKGNTLWGKNVLVNLSLPIGVQTGAYLWDQNNYILGESEVPFEFEGRKSFVDWKKATGFDGQTTLTITPKRRPEGLKTFIRLNHYDPARAHLAVYNWDRKETVRIDLDTFLKKGEHFKILSAQNYFSKAVMGGIYEGEALMLPMVQEPTGPEFGAFVIEKTSPLSGKTD
jgi:hypothetical protein